MLYALTIAYDGTDFHGWQRQIRPASAPEEEPTELRTVQGTLEGALQEVLRLRTHVVGASRTDAGVHAWGQVAVFTPPPTGMRMPEERLAEALNAKLPDDVRVRSCARAREGFDPIGLCQAKGYRYTLALGREAPLWDRRVVHHVRDEQLDLQAMRRCAHELIGRRDFAAMAKAGHGRLSTVRTLFRVDVSEPAPGRVAIDVVGDGFLHHMVRILA
ncbi:MAG: tRNA pseudouridine synthase A, partial [Planctomycetota bacterium]